MNSNNYDYSERERVFDLIDLKNLNLRLGIILGIITLTGAGTIIYFATKKTETKSSQTVEQKVLQLQSQLSQIETYLSTLNVKYIEKMAKFLESCIAKMKEAGATADIYAEAEKKPNEFKSAVQLIQDRFKKSNQESVSQKIKTIQSVYQVLEKVDWKDTKK